MDSDKSGSVDIDEFMIFISNNNILDQTSCNIVMNVINKYKNPILDLTNKFTWAKRYAFNVLKHA